MECRLIGGACPGSFGTSDTGLMHMHAKVLVHMYKRMCILLHVYMCMHKPGIILLWGQRDLLRVAKVVQFTTVAARATT